MRCVSFLTDYGLEDGFVAACHGVIAARVPDARIIDITHLVPPGDVRRAAAVLAQVAPGLPASVHLAVVDPGVGTSRRGLAVAAGDSFLVGPDNGLLPPTADALGGARTAVELPVPPSASRTFHGRDMFAPAAADLLAGIALTDLGQPFDPERLVRLPPPVATLLADGAGVETEVLVVDHFGNVQLAARPALLDEVAQVGTRLVMSAPSSGQAWPVLYGETFASVDPAELVLLADSGGYLAVAANGVSAAERTGLRPGTRVRIVVEKPPGGR